MLATIALFFAFYALNLNVYGSYLLFGLSTLVMLLTALKNHGKITLSFNTYHRLIFQFGVFCLCSAIWAWDSSYSIEKGITILEMLICMSMLGTYYFNKDNDGTLLECVKWAGYAVAIYSIATYGIFGLIRIMQAGERAGTTYANVNSIALVCAYAIVITLYFSMTNGFSLTDLFCIPCIIMVVASGTRKAVVILAIGIVFLLIMTNKNQKKTMRVIGIILILFVIIVFLSRFNLLSGISRRMEGIINLILGTGKVDSTTLKRGQFIAIGVEQFKKTPLFGIGIGNPRILLRNSAFGLDAYLHNNYVELLAGGGIVGFCAYYAIHVYLAIKFWKRRKWDINSQFYLIFIVLMLVSDYGAVSYYSKQTYFFFLMMYTYLFRNSKDSKVKEKENGARA